MARPTEVSDENSDDPVPGGEGPRTALTPVWARVVAFAVIIAGGLGGALVGGRFGEVACTGSCDGVIGASMLAGSLIGALGVAVVAVITLRVAGEWVGGS